MPPIWVGLCLAVGLSLCCGICIRLCMTIHIIPMGVMPLRMSQIYAMGYIVWV
jgi:hypothetical protein